MLLAPLSVQDRNFASAKLFICILHGLYQVRQLNMEKQAAALFDMAALAHKQTWKAQVEVQRGRRIGRSPYLA